jgi:hypothetical protein
VIPPPFLILTQNRPWTIVWALRGFAAVETSRKPTLAQFFGTKRAFAKTRPSKVLEPVSLYGWRERVAEIRTLLFRANNVAAASACLGNGRLPRDGLRHRASAFSAAAHLAFMFLRVICIGVNGVPIFFA